MARSDRFRAEQEREFAVHVLVDDGLGWRIVHEGDSHDEAVRIATMMVVHKYPVKAVEVRDLDGRVETFYNFTGNGKDSQ